MRRYLEPNFLPGADDIDDESFGQVDGDSAVGAVAFPNQVARFQPSSPGQPWLRSPLPPWHLWGNTQNVVTPVETVGQPREGFTQQLLKASYKRPETWHWLFAARLLSGPDNTPTFFTRIFVRFNLTVGIGRSAIVIASDVTRTFFVRPFEEFIFQWGPVGTAFPIGAQIYSTESLAPSRSFQADGPAADGQPVSEIVAQDLQLVAQVSALTVAGNVAAVGQPVTVEVSAQFAPKTHVRPDWSQTRAPHEIAYAGAETGGS